MKTIQSILFTDPQAGIPAGRCPRCGSCVYPPGRHCTRCERGRP